MQFIRQSSFYNSSLLFSMFHRHIVFFFVQFFFLSFSIAQQNALLEKFRQLRTTDERIGFVAMSNLDTFPKVLIEQLLAEMGQSNDGKMQRFIIFIKINSNHFERTGQIKNLKYLEKEAKQNGHQIEYLAANSRINIGLYYINQLSEKEIYTKILNDFETMEQLGIEKFRYYYGSSIFFQMGKIMYELGSYDKSIEILEKTIPLCVETKIEYTLCLNILQNCYYEKRDLNKAIVCAQKIYKANFEINPKQIASEVEPFRLARFWQGLSMLDVASMQVELAQIEIAEKNSENAYQLCKYKKELTYAIGEVEYVIAEFDALMVLFDIKIKLGKISEAKALLKRIESLNHFLNVSKRVGFDYFKPIKLYRNYANYYEKLNEHKTANHYIHLAETLEDSLRRRNDIRKFNLAKQQFDNERYKAQIENIEEENHKQKILTFSAIVAFLLVSFTALLVYRRIKRDKDLIFDQNAMLGKSLIEKDTLLKEIHHRVKNNLQIISGLLERQAMTTQDFKTQKLMLEGQNRVFSMALVHQNLYQSENFTAIEIKNYLSMLVKNIQISHQNPHQNVQLELDIDDSTVDIDTAIPLGLILNELITNCYKYAFVGKDKGLLKICFNQKEKVFHLQVKDDGVGLPSDFETKKEISLGINLVKGLARQLDASFSYISNEEGTVFEIQSK